MQLEPVTEECTKGFEVPKNDMLSTPMLDLPKSFLPYSVDTDASETYIGAASFQTHIEGA